MVHSFSLPRHLSDCRSGLSADFRVAYGFDDAHANTSRRHRCNHRSRFSGLVGDRVRLVDSMDSARTSYGGGAAFWNECTSPQFRSREGSVVANIWNPSYLFDRRGSSSTHIPVVNVISASCRHAHPRTGVFVQLRIPGDSGDSLLLRSAMPARRLDLRYLAEQIRAEGSQTPATAESAVGSVSGSSA